MNQYQNPYYMVPQRRPRAWVNGTLIILNILYFLYLELAGSTEDAYFMLEHGAMYGPFVLRGHEYYRLLTSVFMHFGINHIVNNMLVLFVLGDNLERALGKVKYLIFYLICGVGANVVSMLLEMPFEDWSVGVGASGAIFGVVEHTAAGDNGGIFPVSGIYQHRSRQCSSCGRSDHRHYTGSTFLPKTPPHLPIHNMGCIMCFSNTQCQKRAERPGCACTSQSVRRVFDRA